jgi:hypothetical protein
MYASPDSMLAYVRWGAPAMSRTSVAVQANLWEGANATVTATNKAGIVSIGDTTKAAGYQAVDIGCL